MRYSRAYPVLIVGLAILGLLAPEALWAQCPMCRTALESPEGQALAQAFNRGILFLLSVPFGAIGVVAALVLRSRRSEGLRGKLPE